MTTPTSGKRFTLDFPGADVLCQSRRAYLSDRSAAPYILYEFEIRLLDGRVFFDRVEFDGRRLPGEAELRQYLSMLVNNLIDESAHAVASRMFNY